MKLQNSFPELCGFVEADQTNRRVWVQVKTFPFACACAYANYTLLSGENNIKE